MRLILSLLSLLRLGRAQSWGLWPLYTPLLGDISTECRTASQAYVDHLRSALQTRHTGAQMSEQQRTALAMFDSNGALPFLQEGHLADVLAVDLCDMFAPAPPAANKACKGQLPAGVRTLSVPFGHALAPGTERQCRQVEAKYCYNYFQPFPPVSSAQFRQETNFAPVMARPVIASVPTTTHLTFNFNASLFPLAEVLDDSQAPSNSSDLLELLLKESEVVRKFHSQIVEFLTRSGLAPPRQSAVLQVFGLVLFLWGSYNQNSGVGEWGKQSPLPYQGMCYPAACTKQDIQTSNLEFYKQFAVGIPGIPMAASSPLISDFLAVVAGIDEETADKFRESAVGCTDDYSGHWRAESYVMLTVLTVIAVCILVGTAVDVYQTNQFLDKPLGSDAKRKPAGLGLEIIKCFSLVQNIKFIFQKPSASSQRLGCLEGMRSMSMTWVRD